MRRFRPYRNDLLALALIFALAILWFAPVLLPLLFGKTLLPWDILYTFAPFEALRSGTVPHNGLLADLVLENVVWKQHIREALATGDFPLWNAQVFTGIPFLAGGQASTFYPLNLLFYIFPLEGAYGWFTALQVALAGWSMYLFARVVRLKILAALFAGIVYMFSGFLIVSVVFTMFVAAVPWLPLLLAVIEVMIRKQEEKGGAGYNPIPWVIGGSGVIGMIVLAGHPELIYYSLLVAGAYAFVRLIAAWRMISIAAPHPQRAQGRTRTLLLLAVWLLAMAVLGVALGAVQLIPLVELLPLNFREGSASLAQVREWAWPSRHILTFALPDIFGNPSHHNWFDLWNLRFETASVDAHGNSIDTIFWGIKNYVEGGNYVGIATWLLTAIAALWAVRQLPAARRSQQWLTERFGARPVHFWFFAVLIVVSLLFAFGTPLYAILYYGLPGWNQLHSPFRWVFPMTLALAFLGGMGLDVLLRLADKYTQPGSRRTIRWLAAATALAGVAVLVVIVVSMIIPAPFIDLGQRIVDGSDLAQMAFADGRVFWGYQSMGLLRLGTGLLGSGVLVWLLAGAQGRRKRILCAGALVALVALDLYSAHGRFNPVADVTLDPRGDAGTPPVVKFIEAREEGEHNTWRFTTFNLPGEKTFNPNVGMYYGWHDVRGYDSIIPRQYVDLMEQIAPQSNELLYNRIAPLYSNVAPDPYAVLDNPLLDMLNVKYVLTEHYIPNASWHEIYRDSSIAVYENLEVLPRVRIVDGAQVAPYGEQQLLTTDLRDTVFIETAPSDPNALNPGSAEIAEARISRATVNDIFVDVNISDRAWLMLADAWFPGWKAYIRPFGEDESQETELTLYRANGAMRAVYLPDDGQWTVRFVYSPMSFKLGLYVSFLAFMSMLLLALYWLWGKFYRAEKLTGDVHVVAKNSIVPMGLNLANKAIDFAFAMLYVRLLGPEGTGKWYFVVTLYGFFEIVSRYGLGTLLTRDVAEDKNRSSAYLSNTLTLRTMLWLAMLPILAVVTWFYANLGTLEFNVLGFHLFGGGSVNVQPIGLQEIQAIAILAIAMLFANYADVYSSMFYAFEKMEYPAGLASAAALLKVSLGALVLLFGWSFVGLALVSLIGNVVQMFALWALMRITLFKPQWKLNGALMRHMLLESGPLMINNLLATIFWRIDVWILRPLAGATAVGLYSVGLKYIDGLNIIPSMFTLALFPMMSRHAKREGGSLLRTYVVSIRLLLMVSLPVAAAVTFLARDLVYLIGGAQYLDVPGVFHIFGNEIPYEGGADLAFQFMIWSIPIGFVNSVTQYVLIAVKQQHYLTRAFIIGVVVNIICNFALISRFGYIAAAVTTIFSEFCLLLAFYWSVRRNVGSVPWLALIWRPVVAVAAMLVTSWALVGFHISVWLAVAVGTFVYLLLLVTLGALRGGDMDTIWRALPLGPLRRLILNPQIGDKGA